MSIPIMGWVYDSAPAWDGTAYSIPVLSIEGRYSFKVPLSTVGAVVGLNPDPVVGGNYYGIDLAVDFNKGNYRVMVGGQPVSGYNQYSADDVFTITLWKESVYLLKGVPSSIYRIPEFPQLLDLG